MAFMLPMHTKEAAGGRFRMARTGANRILNFKAFLQIPILSENQDRIAVFKDGFRLDGEIQSAVSTDGDDVDAVFFPDIDLTYAHTDPAFRKIYLIDIVVAFQIDKIKNVVGAEADRSPFRKLLFRVDDLIGTVPQKKFLVNITGSAGRQRALRRAPLRVTLFQGNSGNYRRSRRCRHQNCGFPERKGRTRLYCHRSVLLSHRGRTALTRFLRTVNGHDLMSEVVKMHGNMYFQTAEADQKN